jgi:hypothetical protein
MTRIADQAAVLARHAEKLQEDLRIGADDATIPP